MRKNLLDQSRTMRWTRGLTFAAVMALVAGTGLSGSSPAEAAELAPRLSQQRAAGDLGAVRKDPTIRVDDALSEQLASGKPTRFVIEFRERADLSAAFAMTGKAQWEARGQYVYSQLTKVAERSQAAVRAHLDSAGRSYKPFWVTNVIVVEDGDQSTVQNLLSFSEIAALRIYTPFEIIWPEPVPHGPQPQVVGSNIGWIGADQVWASGFNGQGMTLATIDTGVRYTHEALVNAYRGNQGGGSFDHDYNWFDPYTGAAVPNDSNDHGSHTTGTMIGNDATSTNQIGVAPGAKWIACQGFTPSATDAGLLGCGQFMVAPTRTDGSDANPALRPHAVNNSWGDCGTTYDNWYEGVIDAWIAAGIVPVFSNGNSSNCGYASPPGLNTVGNPARSKKVLGIGSTSNSSGTYATHSNWGPTDDTTALTPGTHPDLMGFDQLKPNIAAPGVSVRSAVRGSDTAYANFSGTSMSAPHVAGLVALMWEAAPCLVGDFATTGTLLMQTARPIDYNSGGTPPPGPGNIPNYATGWGEIDAVDVVDAAILECGPQGTIAGTVTASAGGAPIADARIEIQDMVNNRSLVVFTDASGQYSRAVPEITVGGHDVAVSKYGFTGETVSGVLVDENVTTTVDFQLDAALSHTVSGTVTDATTGWPMGARIDIAGFPGSPVWADPVSGVYTVDLVAGVDYGLVASSIITGYGTAGANLPALAGNAVQDFQLVADGSCTAPGYQPAPVSVWSTDFEANDAGFTHSGTNDSWAWGAPVTWPSSCSSGSSCWGTNLNGNYANSANMALLSPSIDLSAVAPATPLTLRWQQAHHLESATWDQGYAEYSVNAGPWTVMWQHSGGTVQTGWTERSFNITSAAGQSVQFRWRLVSDSSVTYSGLYVDDLDISLAGCTTPVGDLLVGTVRDANTGAGLNGAIVSVDMGAPVAAAASAHPALGDGFYATYVPTGPATVAGDGAPVHPGYGSDSAPVTASGGGTQTLDLAIPAGQLAFTPAAGPSTTLPMGSVALEPFSVANSGGMGADFALQGVGLAEHFEAGVPPTGWSVTNDGGSAGCVWQLNTATGLPNFAGGDGLAAAANADACGSGSTTATSLTTPRIDLSAASSASLRFILAYRHLGGSRFFADVSIDDGATWTNLLEQSSSTSATGPGTPMLLDLSGFVGSSQTRLRFRYTAGWDWYAVIDQIQVFGDFGLIPWLAITPPPPAGSLAPAAVANLNAVFDSASFGQPGTVTAPILVTHNTPYSIAPLQAQMTMTVPPSFGTLNGSAVGLGRCDAAAAPLAGASVLIQGQTRSYQTTTDAGGAFSWQLDSSESPLTVTISASGHVMAQASGLMLAAGGTVSADLDLRAALPCFAASPASLAATVEQNGADSRAVGLSNTGAGELTSWNAVVGGEPGAPLSLFVTQTTSQTPMAATTVSCNAGGIHAENFYLRRYPHSDFGISGPVPVTHIDFAVETATAGSGGEQPMEVRLYRLDGAFTYANMTLLASKSVMVPDQTLGSISVALDAPAMLQPGEEAVAVLYLPDGDPDSHSLFIGSNGGGQTAPTYISAVDCGILEPATMASIGFPAVHVILNLRAEAVGGSCDNPTPVSWLVADPPSGALPADSNSSMQALFDATGLALGSYPAALCVSSSDTGASFTEVAVAMDVVPAVPVVDLLVSASDSADPVEAGNAFSYQVRVENLGPDSTSSVQLQVQLPVNSTYSGNDAGTACTLTGNTLDCSFTDPLAMGGTILVGINMVAGVPGVQQLDASVSSSDSADPDAGNNTASETTTISPAPSADLAISVNAPSNAVIAGTEAAYLVKVANLGGDPVTGVSVALGWPADLSFAGFSGTGWSCSGGPGSGSCVLSGAQASGFAPDLTVRLLVDAGSVGGLRSVSFAVAADQADGNPSNNAVSLDTEVVALPMDDEIFLDGFED